MREKELREAQGRKLFGAVVAVAVLLFLKWLGPVPVGYHWQDDIPARFGLSLGEFVFFLMLFTISCFSLVITAVLRERRKKKILYEVI